MFQKLFLLQILEKGPNQFDVPIADVSPEISSYLNRMFAIINIDFSFEQNIQKHYNTILGFYQLPKSCLVGVVDPESILETGVEN